VRPASPHRRAAGVGNAGANAGRGDRLAYGLAHAHFALLKVVSYLGITEEDKRLTSGVLRY